MDRARAHILFLILLIGSVAAFFVALQAQNTTPQYHSVWDGIYTEKQAQRGEAVYHEMCSACHGDKLTGKESKDAPALTGHDFESEWSRRTVADLFKKIIRKMPQDDPGSLTPQQTADLLAFILNFNKFPSGNVELPPDNESLTGIRFGAKPSDQKKTSPAE